MKNNYYNQENVFFSPVTHVQVYARPGEDPLHGAEELHGVPVRIPLAKLQILFRNCKEHENLLNGERKTHLRLTKH